MQSIVLSNETSKRSEGSMAAFVGVDEDGLVQVSSPQFGVNNSSMSLFLPSCILAAVTGLLILFS